MFNVAIRWQWRTDNPARGIERNQEPARHRYLSAAELVSLSVSLAEHPDQQAANIFRLLLLTGARRSEVAGLRWADLDLAEGVWTKPAATTKQKAMHRVPLSAPARQLLAELHATRSEDSEYVFPAEAAALDTRSRTHGTSSARGQASSTCAFTTCATAMRACLCRPASPPHHRRAVRARSAGNYGSLCAPCRRPASRRDRACERHHRRQAERGSRRAQGGAVMDGGFIPVARPPGSIDLEDWAAGHYAIEQVWERGNKGAASRAPSRGQSPARRTATCGRYHLRGLETPAASDGRASECASLQEAASGSLGFAPPLERHRAREGGPCRSRRNGT